MQFNKKYFKDQRYSQRKPLIKSHILEVLRWGSKISKSNLLDGHKKTALDVGCAYGYGVEILKSLGYCAYGIDISKYSLIQAKKSIKAAHFLVCDVQKQLPFRERTFDLVTCFEVLEHLQTPLKAIEKMYLCCKDTLIYTTPNRLVEKPIKKIVRDFDETHLSVGIPREWEKILSENLKFETLKVESFFDVNVRVRDRLLFFKSFKIPYLGLDIRILIKKRKQE